MTFDFDKLGEIDEKAFRDKLKGLVQDILDRSFPGTYEKRRIADREERLNFACPYCGDSYADDHKKRANIYYKEYGFHCYNCGKHVQLDEFLKDFGKDIDSSEKVFLHDIKKKTIERANIAQQKAFEYYIDFEMLDKYAIDKGQIMRKFRLVEAKLNSKMREYLEGRCQYGSEKFAYEPRNEKLFIFNFTKSGKVLGFQVRNFKYSPKYVTYELEMIYKKLGLDIPDNDEFREANKLSSCFGLNTVDFGKDIIVTEGPMDSFLVDNGMCVCGLKKAFPFDFANIKYMYDYDLPGVKKSLEIAKTGKSVFMWKKYCEAAGIEKAGDKLDWNDAIKLQQGREGGVLSPDAFFTSNKYDLYYI